MGSDHPIKERSSLRLGRQPRTMSRAQKMGLKPRCKPGFQHSTQTQLAKNRRINLVRLHVIALRIRTALDLALTRLSRAQ